MKYLAVLFCVSTVTAVVYKDCGSETGKINSVNISPCPKEPCALKRGTNASIALSFTPNVDSATAKTVVYGIIAGVKVLFPTVPSDACKNNNMPCPIKSGSAVNYTNFVFVQKEYPPVECLVQWEIHDANDKKLACFVVPAIIVS